MTDRELRIQMRKNLFRSYKGWYHWHRLTRKYSLDNTAVVLLPSMDREYNYNALLYLNQMLEQRNFSKALILTFDPAVIRAARLFSEKICEVENFSRKKAEDLMQYYCLYEFDSRFMVASLEEPEGRNAYKLVGKNGTTVAELMAIGVYKISQFEHEDPPAYAGHDPEILNFLKRSDKK